MLQQAIHRSCQKSKINVDNFFDDFATAIVKKVTFQIKSKCCMQYYGSSINSCMYTNIDYYFNIHFQ